MSVDSKPGDAWRNPCAPVSDGKVLDLGRASDFGAPVAQRTEAEINAEKASKPRPDLVPARALHGAAMVMGYGFRKHGVCTWRVAGTEQADPQTHWASLLRHLIEFALDPYARESGSGYPVLWHALSQLAILIDLVENPPDAPGANDGAWSINRALREGIEADAAIGNGGAE